MTLILELPAEVEDALAQEARRRGTTPEGLALDDLRRLYVHETPAAGIETSADEEERQATLRETLMNMLASYEQSDVRETLSPADEAAREAYRNNPVAEIIAEKYRRQGFNV